MVLFISYFNVSIHTTGDTLSPLNYSPKSLPNPTEKIKLVHLKNCDNFGMPEVIFHWGPFWYRGRRAATDRQEGRNLVGWYITLSKLCFKVNINKIIPVSQKPNKSLCINITTNFFQPKMSPTISLSGMYWKPFIIVGIAPILNKELGFIFDMICLVERAFIVRYQYYTIHFRYKYVTQSAFFFSYKNVT